MGLYKRKDSNVYWMCFSYQGRNIRKSTGTADRLTAERIYNILKGKIAMGQWHPEILEQQEYIFDDLMSKFQSEYAPLVSVNQQIRYKVSLKYLMPFFEGLTLNQITPKLISDYQQKRLKEGAKPATANRERDVISKAFNLTCKQWEMASENPSQKVPKLKEYNLIERYLSQEEEERLMQACQPYLDLSDVVIFAISTSMRLGEILNLKWQDVNFQSKAIAIVKTKNKQPRIIPMNDTVYAVLTERNKVRHISGVVFDYKVRLLQAHFKKACKAAQVVNFRFHDLRHSAASRMIQSGVDICRR